MTDTNRMPSIGWMTDIHLNFVGTQQIERFFQDIAERRLDGVIICGDIGESHSFADYLIRMAETLTIPIYFVLGNHDYYFSRIKTVRRVAERLQHEYANLYWLPASGVVPLTATTALVGHGGWADGRYGNFWGSSIFLNDYLLIEDLANLDQAQLLKRLRALADEAAQHLAPVLTEALQQYEHVIVATHAPPFAETCWHEGQVATPDNAYLPHFTCQAMGDLLRLSAETAPDRHITVLAGHTHNPCRVAMTANMDVIVGRATYGEPALQGIIDLA